MDWEGLDASKGGVQDGVRRAMWLWHLLCHAAVTRWEERHWPIAYLLVLRF